MVGVLVTSRAEYVMYSSQSWITVLISFYLTTASVLFQQVLLATASTTFASKIIHSESSQLASNQVNFLACVLRVADSPVSSLKICWHLSPKCEYKDVTCSYYEFTHWHKPMLSLIYARALAVGIFYYLNRVFLRRYFSILNNPPIYIYI